MFNKNSMFIAFACKHVLLVLTIQYKINLFPIYRSRVSIRPLTPSCQTIIEHLHATSTHNLSTNSTLLHHNNFNMTSRNCFYMYCSLTLYTYGSLSFLINRLEHTGIYLILLSQYNSKLLTMLN